MPRKLACLILAFAVCQNTPAGAEPSTADVLLAHGVREIVFAERSFPPDGHWYANFGYFFSGPQNVAYGHNGRLLKLDVKTGQVTTLLEDRRGGVRDPQVHYDARKILFSYRKGGTEQFHLYEINVDGTGLKQLTDGIYDHIEPCYLPDGGIVFVSSRSKRWVQCWQVQVATLHRCDGDGKNIRALSANVEMDNTPWVLPDGRIIYMRWEYVDRSQVKFHHLWTCNPDGTNQTVYYGNVHPTGVFIDANDPDYRAILNFIEMGRLCLQQNKRWDMPGFKPHPFYVREMKRYGILPQTFNPARDDVDVFQIDRRYWASTWHYPDGGGPTLYTNEKPN